MTTRFARRGTAKVWLADAIADTSAPTVAELDDDISRTITPATSFPGVDEGQVVVQPWDDVVAFRHRGYLQADDPVLVVYDDRDDASLRTTLARGNERYLVFFPDGYAGASPAIGDVCEVWHVRSRGPSRQTSLSNIAATTRYALSTIATPVLDAVLA